MAGSGDRANERQLLELAPRERFRWCGFGMEVERQARRTTFARIIDGPLEGVRIQLKRTLYLAKDGS